MTDTPGSRTDSDLGRMLTVEIKLAVRRAMTDPAIKEVLRKEVADQVMGSVSADLEKQIGDRIAKEVAQIEARVAEKVRRDILDSWTLATTVLKKEFEKAPGTVPETTLKALPVVLAPNEAEPVVISQKVTSLFKPRMFTAGKVAAVALVLAVLFIGYLIWFIVTSAPRRSERPGTRREPAPLPATLTQPPAELLSITAQRIRTDWMKVITGAEDQLSPSPLRDLIRAHPFNEQFACWFNDDAQTELEKLARGSLSNDVQEQLEYAFEPCFTTKPILRDPMLAIFSAQATVANAFSTYRAEWDSWCAIDNETSPPTSLIADGFTGPSTYESMNLFLKCTGHSGDLTIEPGSTTPQYLYVTYLALRELQR